LANELPPLPPGFKLDAQPQASSQELPPLPEGFTLDQPQQPRSTGQELGRQTGLAARYGVEGLLSLPGMLANIPAAAANKVLELYDQVRSPTMEELVTGKQPSYRFPDQNQAISGALTSAGLPEPETATERVVGDASRAVAGAGSVIGAANAVPGAISSALQAAPTMQAVSSATSGAASGATREAGGGPVAQMAAGVAGGLTPYAASEGGKVLGRGLRSLVEPLYNGGREQIVGRTLNQVADNPVAAQANMAQAAEIVPGSKPTAGEVAKDYGIISTQRAVKSSNPSAFANRASEQNTARQEYLGVAAKDQAAVDNLVTRRDQVTGNLRNAAFKQAEGKAIDTKSIVTKVDELLADPDNAGETTQKALQWAKTQLEGKTDPRALYAVRKDLAMKMAGKVGQEESVLRYAGKELGEVRDIIDDAIQGVAPVWKQYLTKYRQLSKPIDRMTALQDAQGKASFAPSDALSGREVLTQAKWKSQVRTLLADAKLTKGQQVRVQRIAADLDRGMSLNDPNIRAIGSNTTQDMTAANVLGQALGSTKMVPFVRTISRPLQWIYKIPEEEMQKVLSEAMLDPAFGAELMKRASGSQIQQVSKLLRERFVASGLGTSGAEATLRSEQTKDKEE
jgi:hypothetical protein